MPEQAVVYWIRNDLRLADNPALQAALASERPVVPVFIWSPDAEGHWPRGAADRAWLEQSLISLGKGYEALGSRLLIASGSAEDVLCRLCREVGAETVYAAHRYEPAAREQEAQVCYRLAHFGAVLRLYPGGLINPPAAIETQSGDPYQVFTPYYNRCTKGDAPQAPLRAPAHIPAPATWPATLDVASLELTPSHPWVDKVLSHWDIGEEGAHEALDSFVHEGASSYLADRDVPAEQGTSCLSPRLHFGELSPRQVWHAVQQQASADTRNAADYQGIIRQLYWREFAHHLLYHFPHTPEEPLKPVFARFPWADAPSALAQWQQGQTGYPIIDAGMRQLWETGWMHNRVRMIVASFLVKDLHIHWREGAEWFWNTLIDADLANNTLGWQWVAGCGADAAPYFRVFNPVTQGKKFDPHGEYVRQWVPELADVPNKYVHCPWEMSPIELATCGVTLGTHYPHPMVDHSAARKEALAIYDELKSLAG